jgi:FkbM family methyltransferase
MMVFLRRAIHQGIAASGGTREPDQPDEIAPDARVKPSAMQASPPAPAPVQRSLLKRVGRRSLRALRPVLAPLLYRLEWRIRTAVDKSQAASNISLLEAKLLAGFAAQQQQLITQQQQLTELRDSFTITNDLLGLLRVSFDALYLTRQADRTDFLHAFDALNVTRQADRTDFLQAIDRAIERGNQLLQRRLVPLGSELLVRSLDGWLLIPAEDLDLVMVMAETAGLLEPGTRSVLTKLLAPDAVMVDVGAHIGSLTLAAARAVGTTGRVIALEPTPRTARLLRTTVNLNGLVDRVTVHACAAGAQPGRAMLNMATTFAHSSLLPLEGTTSQVEVEVQPIDALVPAGQRVDLVKVDAEGSELAVWRGMHRVIQENPHLAVIIELGPSHLIRAGVSLAGWLSELSQSGFTAWEIEEASGTLRPLRPIEDLAKIFSINLLLLRGDPASRIGPAALAHNVIANAC